MKRVIEWFDAGGPRVFGKRRQPADVGVKRAIREKAQHAGQRDRVVEPSFDDVRLADEGDRCHRSAIEPSFHGGERDLLVPGDELCLMVAGWEGDDHRRDESECDTPAQVHVSVPVVHAAKPVVRAGARDHERPRDQRGRLVVGEHTPRPRVHQVAAEVGELERTVGRDGEGDRVLHERVGGEDEIRRQPSAGAYADAYREMRAATEPRFAEHEGADQRAFQEEREHSFHREGLPNHAARVP